MSTKRLIKIKKNVLDKNDILAASLRLKFNKNNVFVVNIVSSPGSGKTELLAKTLTKLKQSYHPAAITGDLATENDANRLSLSGVPTKQILTGTMCHLEADLVKNAIKDWNLSTIDILFIENVGNLVCPGGFDLGEDLRVMLVSTTEGEDKPLKYPSLTRTADVVIINKIDLAEVVECNVPLLSNNIQTVQPDAHIIKLSAKTGKGMNKWIGYLEDHLTQKKSNAYA